MVVNFPQRKHLGILEEEGMEKEEEEDLGLLGRLLYDTVVHQTLGPIVEVGHIPSNVYALFAVPREEGVHHKPKAERKAKEDEAKKNYSRGYEEENIDREDEEIVDREEENVDNKEENVYKEEENVDMEEEKNVDNKEENVYIEEENVDKEEENEAEENVDNKGVEIHHVDSKVVEELESRGERRM
ncbi:ring-infected erythrocyte surface antigen-like [Asparagus officinalis]|uniref:ring-infected erythrocyte surface antigen-like n=1 Tax=Asparagus officinalis TaxID=4686 RepID=UPI00098E3944|nr:ring-infected erythrocyte surface antigen-like [Asparagus officinalis]